MREASAARTCWRQQRPRAAVVGAVRHTYISKQNVARRFPLLCRGVNSICGKQSAAEYTKKPFSQFKQAELHSICGKQSAAEYTYGYDSKWRFLRYA